MFESIFRGMKHANSFCCVDMFKITLIELNTEIFVRIGFSLHTKKYPAFGARDFHSST